MKKEILSRLILEHVKVTWEGKVGNYTQFVSYKTMFWLALPFLLLKVPSVEKQRSFEVMDFQRSKFTLDNVLRQ